MFLKSFFALVSKLRLCEGSLIRLGSDVMGAELGWSLSGLAEVGSTKTLNSLGLIRDLLFIPNIVMDDEIISTEIGKLI